ncbi:Phosphofurin acidic cluster sorting protein 2 [Dufourea novaeangliae]|uniref:Phosphofurin acidic cluster sorting protein 2 n=1 Tax=Dufourea novaeangliae TaxID=178035 RepID=A0A154P415_DUFNO|nr:Phosphofurin acidic cluster sorting protein 2 [Dufourea novaeangliae]
MAERTKTTAPATRPVPMKLFATWEVDRTAPDCIPRLCSLTLTRLVILRPLGSDLTSISIAVKMHGSKRTLRSNEMAIPIGGMLDTDLELQFALQYPHFLKRDGNKLLILLQRRKRYKNRTMLGYKTLAEGVINMAQVLQKQMDLELELVSDKAEKYGGHSVALARVSVVALSSQPVDQDKRLMNDPNERLCPEYSDEEEEFSSEGEAEGSDSEPTIEMHRRKSRAKIPANARVLLCLISILSSGSIRFVKTCVFLPADRLRTGCRPPSTTRRLMERLSLLQQRNLKQKFIALLKRRFRVSEDLDQDQEEIGQKLSGGDMEIEELFDELEDLSDSGPELDTMSVSSTPKPSLRPFFSSSRSLLAPPHSGVTCVLYSLDNYYTEFDDDSSKTVYLVGWLCIVACYDSVVVTNEETGNAPATAVGQQSAGQLPKEKHRVGHTTPERESASSRGSIGYALRLVANATAGVEHFRDLQDFCYVLYNITINSKSPNLATVYTTVVYTERGVDRQSDDSSRRADSDSHPENWTDHEANDPPNYVPGSPPKSEQHNKTESSDRRSRLFTRDRGAPGNNKSKKHSLSVDLKPPADLNSSEPRKALVEQLSRVLPDDSLPDAVSLVSLADPGGALLATRLQERNHRVLTTASPADVRATFTCLVTRIQKFCNSSAKPPAPIKVVIAGGDSFVNTVLRHYVDLLSFRPPDWQNYLKFLVVPLGSNTLSKYLSSIDGKYSMLFGEEWKELLEREGGGASECAARVSEYLADAGTTMLLPIAEAMVTYRETDDSSQIFIPFINDVRVGCPDSSSSASVDLEESNVTMSGSPPSLPPPGLPIPPPGRLTPPSSPNVGQPMREGWEPVELQLDYWSKHTQGEKGKNTLRQAFRALHVQRLPGLGETPGHHLSMNYTTKEKKQKNYFLFAFFHVIPPHNVATFTVMRLGKKKEKEKENEPKSQTVEGVTRLICSAKTHNIPLRVSIDGTEWYGVKFFQLSAQWQTHIKTFPIALLEYSSQQQTPNPTATFLLEEGIKKRKRKLLVLLEALNNDKIICGVLFADGLNSASSS